ncbi:MAG: universal stress protein [Myxococcota bacterium]
MTPTRILVPTDFSDASGRALEFARSLQKALGVPMHVLHIHVDPFVREDGTRPESLWRTSEQRDQYMEGLRTLLQREVDLAFSDKDDKPECHLVAAGQPVEQILKTAEEVGADLICIGTTGKGAIERVLLGSVAQRLVRQSSIPILTVR